MDVHVLTTQIISAAGPFLSTVSLPEIPVFVKSKKFQQKREISSTEKV